MKAELDHIHIVVKDVDKAVAFFELLLGISFTKDMQSKELAKKWHYRSRMASLGTIGIELLQPTSPESLFARFIERRGEGIQAISLKVDDIEDAIKEMQTSNIRLVSTLEHGGLKEAQFHPKDAFGVMIELCQYQAVPGATLAAQSKNTLDF
ncbi:VOC family protein [Chloroflexota bacterium]